MNVAVLASPWGIVLALTAYRLTRLWVDDVLPPLPRVRRAISEWAGDRWDREEAAALELDREFGDSGTPRLRALRSRRIAAGNQPALTYLIDCYWCAGFWIALAVVLIAALVPVAVWAIPFAALALSAVTGLLAQHADTE